MGERIHGDGSIRGGSTPNYECRRDGIFKSSDCVNGGDIDKSPKAQSNTKTDKGFYGHMEVNKMNPPSAKASRKNVMF